MSIFTTQEKPKWALNSDWVRFLNEKQVNAPVTLVWKPKGESSNAATIPDEPELTCAQNDWKVKFTSFANVGRFSRPSAIIDPASGVVALGLDETATLNTTLSEVLKTFVGPGKLDGLVGSLFTALTDAAELKLESSNRRNAMWCIPGQRLSVSTALTYSLTAKARLDKMTEFLRTELGFKLTFSSMLFHCQKSTSGIKVARTSADLKDTLAESFDISQTYDLTLQISTAEFDVWFQVTPGDFRISVTNRPEVSFWDSLGKISDDIPTTSVAKPGGSSFSDHVELLSLTVGKNSDGKAWWNVQVVAEWKAGARPVVIGLEYDSLKRMFSGQLLLAGYFDNIVSLPSYRVGMPSLPKSFDIKGIPVAWNIADLFSEVESIPKALPTSISSGLVSYTMGSPAELFFEADLVRQEPQTPDSEIPTPFTWDELKISVTKSTSFFSFSSFSSFTLRPRASDIQKYSPASLSLALNYQPGNWRVEGYVEDLSCGLLLGFFDSDFRDDLTDMVGKLFLRELHVLYTYQSQVASSFLLSGIVQLGLLELRLFYQYVGSNATGSTAAELRRKANDPLPLKKPSKGAQWSFECRLGAAGGKTTLGEIVDSIVDDEDDLIPDFVKDIEIAAASSDESLLSLKVAKSSTAATTNIVFNLKVNILGVKFSFVQVSSKTSPLSKPQVRRIIRLRVDKLPIVDKIPLLNQLPQPFDQMYYMWVSKQGGNLLQRDAETINAALDPDDQLLYKAVTKPDPNAIAIQAGHHFVIVNNGKVVLDHVFAPEDDERTRRPAASGSNSIVRVTAAASNSSPPNNNATKGSLTKVLGPLTISAISLQYKQKVLWITMDAVLQLGPIALGLLGFGIGVPTKGLKLDNLTGILKSIEWQLNGMSITFNQPPILIAGMFEHQKTKTAGKAADIYRGGVGVGFPPYTFVGIGEYASITEDATATSAARSYKSIFIFAKLDGPLVTLEFATISGVRLGFGFNSVVRSPSIDELTSFPFISDSAIPGAGNDPMAIMRAMTPGWVTPKENSYWLAAGMTVTAFELLAVTAVAMFAFRDSGVVISIYADAVAQLPPKVKEQHLMILYVEIGLVAEMNFIDGYFRVEASLAPTSFLLVPQCRLTGGFALVYWFGNSPHSGDWVFSIGGYHRAYQPPLHYPVPDRVGISFTVGNNIQIIGQSYFAITPKVAMGGALIHISLSVGPVSAFLDASFDALINFHPLHYMADFRVAVGVTFDADIWFIHIHISVTISADLHIEGPEFGGVAHVDFYLFAFDVQFGAPIRPPPPQTLIEYWELTHKPGPEASDRPSEDSNPLKTNLLYWPNYARDSSVSQSLTPEEPAIKFVLQTGNFPMPAPEDDTSASSTPAGKKTPMPSTGAGSRWFVKGGSLKFSILSDFALSGAKIQNTTPEPSLSAPGSVYSRPMQLGADKPIKSELNVVIKKFNGQKAEVVGGWQEVSYVIKALPTAMWAPYTVATDPMRASSQQSASLLDGSVNVTVPLATGIVLSAPLPFLAKAAIPKFKATAAQRLGIRRTNAAGEKEDWLLPDHDDTQRKFLGKSMSSEEKSQALTKRWSDMAATWKASQDSSKPISDPNKGLLAMAATDVFKWDVDRPQGETTDAVNLPPWQLSSKAPVKLLDRLTDIYLALPRIAVQ